MPEAPQERVGGRLCLDVINTLRPRHGERPVDAFTDYALMLRWFESTDAELPRSFSWLRRQAAAEPRAARAALDRVVAVRDAMYAVFAASIEERPVKRSSLGLVNEALGEAHVHHRLVLAKDGRLAEGWSSSDALDQVLFPVAIDAWDLLTEPELAHVKECPSDDGCGRLFLDTSRNGTRRWCDMASCGNRAKTRAHYRRTRN